MALLRVVAISDTHGRHRRLHLPPGDLLIHAGDMTPHGEQEHLIDFNAWLGEQPYTHKVVIAGNHDGCFEQDPAGSAALITNAHYLFDSAIELAGLRIYGSPWTPVFLNLAFNLERGAALRARWAQIPSGIDILITHGPPHGIGDQTVLRHHVGCEELRVAVERLAPRVHVFGHIHEAAGMVRHGPTIFLNACSFGLFGQSHQPPVVELDLEAGA